MAGRKLSLQVSWWITRALTVASIAFLMLFVVANLVDGGPVPTISEWSMLCFFPGGVLIGLILGLRSAAWGGIVAIASFCGFYLVHLTHSGEFPQGPYFLLFALPGLLLVFDSWVQTRMLRMSAQHP